MDLTLHTDDIEVTLPADIEQIDATGHVWTFVDMSKEPTRIKPDAVIVAGTEDDPVLARVVDVIDVRARQLVHLDVLAHVSEALDELRHAHLL